MIQPCLVCGRPVHVADAATHTEGRLILTVARGHCCGHTYVVRESFERKTPKKPAKS